MFVIGLTGMNGCGKSSAADYLKGKGFKKLVFSDFLKKEAEKRGILTGEAEENKNRLSEFGDKIRKEKHRGIIADFIVDYIKENKIEKAVIDGFRSKEEVEVFKKNIDNFTLVKIEINDDIRIERMRKRDPNATEEIIKERDKRDLEALGLREVLEMSDTSVDNNSSLEDMHKQLENTLSNILQ